MLFSINEEIDLKLLELEDAPALFGLVDANRNYLRKWLPWVDTNVVLEDSKAFIQSSQEQQKQNLGFQCGIWYRHQLVGIIGFHRIDWLNRNAEIGYWLSEAFQGKGIMTQSCRYIVDYAFTLLQLHRIQIRCATENKKSFAVIERLGFFKEGMTRQAEFLYDHYVDLYVFGMTADDWRARAHSVS